MDGCRNVSADDGLNGVTQQFCARARVTARGVQDLSVVHSVTTRARFEPDHA